MEQPQQQDMMYVQNSNVVLTKEGNVIKDGILSLCPYAPKIPYEKGAKSIQAIAGPKPFNPADFQFIEFPCTTRCPKCNVMEVRDPNQLQANNEPMLMAYVLEITCNGSITQYDLPAIPPHQQPPPNTGMKAGK